MCKEFIEISLIQNQNFGYNKNVNYLVVKYVHYRLYLDYHFQNFNTRYVFNSKRLFSNFNDRYSYS